MAMCCSAGVLRTLALAGWIASGFGFTIYPAGAPVLQTVSKAFSTARTGPCPASLSRGLGPGSKLWMTATGTSLPVSSSSDESLGSRSYALVENEQSTPDAAQKPLILCLPGLEGKLASELPLSKSMKDVFEVETMSLQDGLDFEQTVDLVVEQLRSYDAERHILLLGEGTGALTALGAALRCPKLIKGLALLDPLLALRDAPSLRPALAASFLPTPPSLPFLPPLDASSFLAAAALPLASSETSSSSSSSASDQERARLLLEAVGGGDSLRFRLDCVVGQGARRVTPRLEEVLAETVVVVSGAVPSAAVSAAADLLRSRLPNVAVAAASAHQYPLTSQPTSPSTSFFGSPTHASSSSWTPGASGSALDLARLLRLSKLLPPEIRLDPILDFAVPPRTVASPVQAFTQLCSPQFFSTDPETGWIVQGLRNLPEKEPGKPLLFVGNHQFLGADTPIMIDEVYRQTGTFVRGLAHPLVFGGTDALRECAVEGNWIYKFGGVPVSARNAARLIAGNEAVLLFPGGHPETVLPGGPEEPYRLMWPEDGDFVRLAAKFNATIVPFAGVGAFEFFNYLGSTDAARQSVDSAAERAPRPVRAALQGLTAGVDAQFARWWDESVALRYVQEGLKDDRLRLRAPNFIVSPKAPWEMPRFYYVFGAPVDTTGIDHRDRGATAAAYRQLRDRTESGIGWLLERREADRYREPAARFVYEATNRKQAPTFNIFNE